MKKALLIFLSLISCSLFAQDKESMYASLEYSEFDGYSGYGYSISFEKSIYDYFAVEISLTNLNGNNFPKKFNSYEYTSGFEWFDKTRVIDLSLKPHITFINNSRHFFSFFGGIGIMKLNSDTFFANQYVSGNFTKISRSLGFQYKFYTTSKYFVGVKITELQALSNTNLNGLVDYSISGGIIIGKQF